MVTPLYKREGIFVKKRAVFLLVLLLGLAFAFAGQAEDIPLDEEHFPDWGLRTALSELVDLDQDGVMSQAEMESVTDTNLSGTYHFPLKVLALFPNLESLSVRIANAETLDTSIFPKLKKLDCTYSSILTLDLSGNPLLEELIATCTSLTKVDVSHNPLLKRLIVNNTELGSLDVSANPLLEELNCGHCGLSELDISNNPALVSLRCNGNHISYLDTGDKANLRELDCEYNNLTELALEGCAELTELTCSNCQLTSLDLSHCPKLKTLNCRENRLAYLDLSGNPQLEAWGLSTTLGYPVTAVDGVIDLAQIPGIDPDRIVNLMDGRIENGCLILDNPEGSIFYSYQVNDFSSPRFYLDVTAVINDKTGYVPIDEAHFPDPALRALLAGEYYDRNGDGELNPYENSQITSLSLDTIKDLRSLAGIKYLTALRALTLGEGIASLDTAECPGLQDLHLNNSGFVSLDLSQCPNLEYLYCSGNHLTSLNLNGCRRLQNIVCDGNQLTELILGENESLKYLDCSANRLTQLDVSGVPNLETLSCQENLLTRLDTGACPKLRELKCGNNLLAALDLSGNPQLLSLQCEYNLLSRLDLSMLPRLDTLICWANRLTELDLSRNRSISSLSCAFNRLSCLDVSGLELVYLSCNDNQRTIQLSGRSFDLSSLPGFNPQKASRWEGGWVRGYDLFVQDGAKTVTYEYDIGYEVKVPFTFVISQDTPDSIPVDEAHFPDPVFRAYVSAMADADESGALSAAERDACEIISLSGLGIATLTGVEHFENLQMLDCSGNRLETLDLTGLSKLSVLNCAQNLLTRLDVSVCPALSLLSCQENKLTSLDVRANPALVLLLCGDNQLTYLDLSANPELAGLSCPGNHLSCVDVRANTKLAAMDCDFNRVAVTAENGRFDLSALPGFDPGRASHWQGGTLKDGILLVSASGPVIYSYECGENGFVEFTLDVTVTGNPEDPDDELVNRPGNVNGDKNGIVDGRDVLRLARYLAGHDVEINLKAADVNGDGAVDGRDLLRLSRYIAGQNVELK